VYPTESPSFVSDGEPGQALRSHAFFLHLSSKHCCSSSPEQKPGRSPVFFHQARTEFSLIGNAVRLRSIPCSFPQEEGAFLLALVEGVGVLSFCRKKREGMALFLFPRPLSPDCKEPFFPFKLCPILGELQL